mmetsp:Transcript_24510/g.62061  ORF Transcript_24510/g.62061 Transcript_24510/m.62061 type:complete len:106 (+) Transcript_24510:85-402(+)
MLPPSQSYSVYQQLLTQALFYFLASAIPRQHKHDFYRSLAGIDSAAVEWRPFVVLAATIWAEDLNEVVRLIFSVFDEDSGGMSLTPSRFEELYSALGECCWREVR